jgi:DegV family protein with EDD domain
MQYTVCGGINMKPIIFTDASCDLPLEFIEKNEIYHLGLIFTFKGGEYEDDFGKTLSYKEFYDGLRQGEMPCTSQINEYKFIKKFEELAKLKRPIIYIGMSSALSGTFNSAELARNTVLKHIPDAEITVIDTKCASLGQGLLVSHAARMRDAGHSAKEIIVWVTENMKLMNHWFAVEDLSHLKRGGRISATTAVVGGILDIKPIIYLTEEGKLKNITNSRGKKKALRMLADKYKEKCDDFSRPVGISHGDCLEDAMHLRDILASECGINEFIINNLGAGLGSHCGYGMVAVCFVGKTR